MLINIYRIIIKELCDASNEGGEIPSDVKIVKMSIGTEQNCSSAFMFWLYEMENPLQFPKCYMFKQRNESTSCVTFLKHFTIWNYLLLSINNLVFGKILLDYICLKKKHILFFYFRFILMLSIRNKYSNHIKYVTSR